VTGDWRRLHNEELHNLYAAPDVIKVVKSRRVRWAGACSTHGKDEKFVHNSGLTPKGRDHLEDVGVDGRIILKWISEGERVIKCGLDSSGSGEGPVAGCCEHGNESSSSITGGGFTD
jgi:hypothetical protein